MYQHSNPGISYIWKLNVSELNFMVYETSDDTPFSIYLGYIKGDKKKYLRVTKPEFSQIRGVI